MNPPTAGQLWLSHWQNCEHADLIDMHYCDHPDMPECPMHPSDAIKCPTADARLLRLIDERLSAGGLNTDKEVLRG